MSFILCFSDEELPPLIIETDTNANTANKSSTVIQGRRVVDLDFFMKEYDRISKHATVCTGGKFVLQNEKRTGLKSTLKFECKACNRIEHISTEPPEYGNNINTAFVWGAVCVGIGHSQAEELFSIMDVPVLGGKHFMEHEKIVGQVRSNLLLIGN